MRGLKVLLVHNFYRSGAPSGEDAVFATETQLLRSSGAEVVTFTLHNDDIRDHTRLGRASVAARTTWAADTFRKLRLVIAAEKPDIAHFHNTFPQVSPAGYYACRRTGVPVVQTLHNYRLICAGGMLLRDQRPCEKCVGTTLLPALRHRCYRGSLAATGALTTMLLAHRMLGTYDKAVDRYICLTRFAADVCSRGGLPADRIRVKGNTLVVGDRQPRDAAPLPQAVFVGRLTQEKGVRTLLDAWPMVDGVRLIIVGDGEQRPDLQAYAEQRRLNVEFLGLQPRDRVLDIVSSSLFQIIPSQWYEGFPMVLLEAYASGVPVIASRIGSLEELVHDGVTGYLFDPGDPRGLADAVNKLVHSGNPGAFGRAARRIFDEEHAPARNIEMLRNIYAEVLDERSRRRPDAVH